jgi:hypothetical protein
MSKHDTWADGDWGIRGLDDETVAAVMRHFSGEQRSATRPAPLFDGEITDPAEALAWLADVEILHVEESP